MSNQGLAQKVILSFDTARYVCAPSDPLVVSFERTDCPASPVILFSDTQPLTPPQCQILKPSLNSDYWLEFQVNNAVCTHRAFKGGAQVTLKKSVFHLLN